MLFEAMSAVIGQCGPSSLCIAPSKGGTYERNPTFQGDSLLSIFTSRGLSGFFIVNKLNLQAFQQHCYLEVLQSQTTRIPPLCALRPQLSHSHSSSSPVRRFFDHRQGTSPRQSPVILPTPTTNLRNSSSGYHDILLRSYRRSKTGRRR